VSSFELVFCTYFKKIERFKYEYEIYDEYVAFCVKQGSFTYQIGDENEQIASEGEIVICPPNHRFSRKIKEPAELCMIKFNFSGAVYSLDKKVKVTNCLRFYEDLDMLNRCLFCDTLSDEPIFLHYCMDILYLAISSIEQNDWISDIKNFIDNNYDKEIYIRELAKQAGYTTPYLINKFKFCYGVSPKVYLSRVRIIKAKEMLLTTDKLSREIADILGFTDELYFIRFFKKHTGLTPRQFKENVL